MDPSSWMGSVSWLNCKEHISSRFYLKYDLCVLRGLACDSNIFPHIQYILIISSWSLEDAEPPKKDIDSLVETPPTIVAWEAHTARCNGSILAVSKTCKSAWKRWKRICRELLMWFNGAKKKPWASKQHLKPRSLKWRLLSFRDGKRSGLNFQGDPVSICL